MAKKAVIREPRKGFSSIDQVECRREPRFGAPWFETEMDEERRKFIEDYYAET